MSDESVARVAQWNTLGVPRRPKRPQHICQGVRRRSSLCLSRLSRYQRVFFFLCAPCVFSATTQTARTRRPTDLTD